MKLINHSNGVVYYVSDKIKSPHAFATRLGGVSANEHTRSLNLAFGRGDEKDVVLENLRIYCEAVGIEAESVVSMPQIHSSKVICITSDARGEGYFKTPSDKCDGYVTCDIGTAVGIKTADCTPILLEDSDARVIAAIHAGWRGTFSDICGEGVRKMIELGAKASNIVAAIGPSICQKCYEVGEDVYQAAVECMGADASGFFKKTNMQGKYLADVRGAARQLLLRAGINENNIESIDICTYEHPELFWSHRYTQGVRGTMLNVIALR
jgi:YfiH family protein